jgi:hypothetical protein
LAKIGFREQVHTYLALATQGSNRGHDVATLLEAFKTSVWCGANRFLYTEFTRNDAALRTIFGWKAVPGLDAYKRYFNKIYTNYICSDEPILLHLAHQQHQFQSFYAAL